MKLLKRLLAALVLLFLLVQIVRPARLNPPVTASIEAPDEVLAILRQSCFDCHSNETAWPWYSHIAPFSWLIAHDVEEAREHLNFSDWGVLDDRARHDMAEECVEEIAEGEMPLWFYTPLHSGSRVDGTQLAVLRRWAASI